MSNKNLTMAKKSVLKLGANANYQNKKGETPLMIGAETVTVLSDAKDFINWGFDFTTVDNEGKDAFIHALENNRGDNSQSIIAFFAQQCGA
jgi:ankyrin repeat protein